MKHFGESFSSLWYRTASTGNRNDGRKAHGGPDKKGGRKGIGPAAPGKGRPRGRSPLTSAERQERKEDALRPSRFLGYDREAVALYLFARGAYSLAEAQFRRMVWLNPFESRFYNGLVQCLLAQNRKGEAEQCAREALARFPRNIELKRVGG